MAQKRALNKKFFLDWLALFIVVFTLIQVFEFYNLVAGLYQFPLIPTKPIYWPITAAFGLSFLYPLMKLWKRPVCLYGLGILFAGWVANLTLFYPLNGTQGYEVVAGAIIFMIQSVALLLPIYMADEEKPLLKQMLVLSIVLAVYWMGISVLPDYKLTFIVNTFDYYYWFLIGNLLFLARQTATWSIIIDTKTGFEASQETEYKEAA